MMKWAILGARGFLGLVYFVFGLNGFLQFLPMPPMPESAGMFMGALASSGYFFPVLKLTETAMGALLLAGVYVPLALVVLAPITLQIFLFHANLTPGVENLVMPLIMGAAHVFLGWAYMSSYKSILQMKSKARA